MKERIASLIALVSSSAGIQAIFSAFFLFIVTGVLWWDIPRDNRFSDLTSNLFAASFDSLFTLGAISFILHRNEKIRTRPFRFAVYSRSNRLLAAIGGIWFDMVKASAADRPAVGSDLLQSQYIEQVSRYLDLAGPSGVLKGANVEMSWRERIVEFSRLNRNQIDAILRRYHAHIDPELLRILEELEKIPTFLTWEKVDLIEDIMRQRGNALHNALPFVQDFETTSVPAIRRLHQRLSELAAEFTMEKGFSPPWDISFREKTALLETRNDFAPRLGSSRRNYPPVAGACAERQGAAQS